MGIFTGILALLGCNPQGSSQKGSNHSADSSARQIKINEMVDVLKQLKEGRLEFDFFGITSTGVDCVYFVQDGEKFDLEFEAIGEEQMPSIEKLKRFAQSQGYEIVMTTYGNKPRSGNLSEAPVIRIETNSDLTTTARIAADIQTSVFGNSDDTIYDVVP